MMSWREFFVDPLLQQLIEQVLDNNTDLNSARLAVEKSEASLMAARLAYLPAISLGPQGTIASFDQGKASQTYNLPLQMSMDLDVFGSITNKKRAAKAVLKQAQMREEMVRANLISTTAQQYYMLQLLDRQLDILTKTEQVPIDKLYGHGGFFKTPGVGQRMLSAAVGAPVSVMETAGEGGPYGMALLCAYMLWKEEGESLADYLDNKVFAGTEASTLMAEPSDIAGFSVFLSRYRKALPLEKCATEVL
jgi:hypothetical protein